MSTSVNRSESPVAQPPPENIEDECLQERYWSYFLASSLIFFLVGLIAILSWRLASHFMCQSGKRKKRTEVNESSEVGLCTQMKWKAEGWISGQTPTGRILVKYNFTKTDYYLLISLTVLL